MEEGRKRLREGGQLGVPLKYRLERLHLSPERNSTVCDKGISSEAGFNERQNSLEFTRMKERHEFSQEVCIMCQEYLQQK